ncbi:HRDC domain-containing protein/DNA_pol_A_exo1 domain-containing protein [Cephalotus follicularis]|uniref:HRDC domain-containing protein/DNA_pol_A_exo1 domain-containing protein n=1 Tax=Cephalotus follicularis TaxID=3775 RepID=A0A1Q3BGB7_CEPFO|nr:HRDC domain-containing protein/DNA_pol_A_exo1 domain-containing protein [Cephalotus follicularis]
MENREKIRIAMAIASFVALSILFTSQYRRRRKQKCPATSCYLRTDHKPQCTFKRVLADNSYSPFNHLKLNQKTHNEISSNSHPYEAEIMALMENPQVEYDLVFDDLYLRMSDSYVWVETESQLSELADVLSRERVFGVDTEQHSLRSFLGFTALIQISTKKEDYLVDTIALHDAMDMLRPVFADPSICKVFHGADNDILWLQRDFHIYIVNLFDTAKACDLLSKPQRSLAYLLETYCGVATNKLLQREDWRQRPFSVEMVQYSRTDAHYLLYIANCLIAELKEKVNENSSCLDDKLHFVLEGSRRSNMMCLQLYMKEIQGFPGESAASSILSRHINGQGCNTQFQDLVRGLCAWRDLMARVHDESERYVLSDEAIVVLADKVPATSTDIYQTIANADQNVDSNFNSSLPSLSPVVCSHLDNLCHLIQDNLENLDDIFPATLQNCLGPKGSCPLSISNYALLVNGNLKPTNRIVSKKNGVKNSKQVARKSSRDLFVQKFSCKSPVYHNCRIYANDGRLLCYCDRRKLEWYLCRDLAKLADENPPAIMLLFEPKGRPEDEDNDFYIQSKKNICVGCGEGDHYLRYRIIPSCYRMHFPEQLKSHRSHDIVLLCVDCHEVAHAAAEKYKKQVADEFGIPLFVCKVVDSKQAQVKSESSAAEMNFEEVGVSPLQLRTAAMALLRHGPRMPSNRLEELTQIVMRYYGGREISENDLERALLVGMTPHEKRKFEKRRGLSFKHSASIMLPDEKQENNTDSMAKSATAEMVEVNTLDDSHATLGEPFDKDIGDLSTVTDADIHEPSTCSDLGVDRVGSGTFHSNNGINYCDTKDVCGGNTDDTSEGRSSPNETVDLFHPRRDGSAPPNHHSKLSLLGHGPHGKQVVDYLLKQYKEDGIRQFCQRWRQVFVEAIHPHFLPAGWDIAHSGRREFGEFSVYNPAKKASVAAAESKRDAT